MDLTILLGFGVILGLLVGWLTGFFGTGAAPWITLAVWGLYCLDEGPVYEPVMWTLVVGHAAALCPFLVAVFVRRRGRAMFPLLAAPTAAGMAAGLVLGMRTQALMGIDLLSHKGDKFFWVGWVGYCGALMVSLCVFLLLVHWFGVRRRLPPTRTSGAWDRFWAGCCCGLLAAPVGGGILHVALSCAFLLFALDSLIAPCLRQSVLPVTGVTGANAALGLCLVLAGGLSALTAALDEHWMLILPDSELMIVALLFAGVSSVAAYCGVRQAEALPEDRLKARFAALACFEAACMAGFTTLLILFAQ